MIHSTQIFHSLKLAALTIAMVASPCVAFSATLTVPTQHPTIQGALNAAQNGDTVLVQPGTYPGSILRFSGKAIHLKSTNGPAVTKIQGDGANPVFNLAQGETRTTIIEGFTITAGAWSSGGGMILNGTSPVVRRNIFTDNRATGAGAGGDGRGGAIFVANAPANPLIIDNIFTNNEAAAHGGAIHTNNVIAEIRGNTFTNNRAITNSGGAILSAGSNAPVTIIGNAFDRNTAVFAGGAISVFGASAIIRENVITNNNGGVFGGGIHLETQARIGNRTYTVRNNRIEANSATTQGGGILTYMENTASPVDISHNVIIGNTCAGPACTSAQSSCGLGGGIGSFDGTATMTVRDNLIRDNVADFHGAAVFTTMPLAFTDNQVINNQAHRAQPGITTVGTSSTQIARNTFRSNHFTATGGDRTRTSAGAIRVQNFRKGALVEGNLFIANQGMQAGAVTVGGGDGSTARITGNTFAGNRLQEPKDPGGGAIWMQDNGTICNNTFTGNDLYGIRIKRLASPAFVIEVSFNHFFGNSMGLLFDPPTAYTTVTTLNAAAIADNNIDGNPLFVGDGSYRLSSVSPLVSKANSACFRLATDVQGEPRLQPTDIGADEFSLKDPDTIALFRPAWSTFYLRNSNTTGPADLVFQYGTANSGWVPLAGDWNGDSIVTTGFFDRATSTFHLRNSNTSGTDDLVFKFGPSGTTWTPLAGDWDGNRTTTVGFYRPETGQFFLRNHNSPGLAEVSFSFGPANAGWLPIVGDWNGDGRQTVGLFNPSTSTFSLRNSNTSGIADITFNFGSANAGLLPIAGDWNGDQIAGIGLYRPSTSTFFLRNSLTSGIADRTFNYGPAGAGWKPLGGQWDGF